MAGFLDTTVLHPALLYQTEPVSSILATTESCLPPIWIKRCAMNCRRPGGTPPQRNVGAAEVSGQRSQIRGSRFRVQSLIGSPGRRPGATTQAVTTGPPLRPLGSHPVPIAGWPAVTKPFRRNSASHRKAVPPSACGNSPAPVCAPAPWLPRCCLFWLSSARRNAWLLRCSDERNSPLR